MRVAREHIFCVWTVWTMYVWRTITFYWSEKQKKKWKRLNESRCCYVNAVAYYRIEWFLFDESAVLTRQFCAQALASRYGNIAEKEGKNGNQRRLLDEWSMKQSRHAYSCREAYFIIANVSLVSCVLDCVPSVYSTGVEFSMNLRLCWIQLNEYQQAMN